MLTDTQLFPIAQGDEQRLDRRRFLGLAGCAALLVGAGEWAAAALDAAPPPPLTVTLEAPLAAGETRTLTAADGREALAVRLDDGAVVAFDRRCPHLGCPVVWSAAHGRFECPCHHAAFDARSGRVLFGPPRRGLAAAAVRLA